MVITAAEWMVAGRRLVAAAGSVVGNRYRDNFDVLHLGNERPLVVVADGMGDGPGSSAAGRTSVEVFVREAVRGNGAAALRHAVAEVQRAVREAGSSLPDLTGCTLTAFVADGSGLAGSDAAGNGAARDGTAGNGWTGVGPAGNGVGGAGVGGVGEAAAWIVQLGDSRVYRVRDRCFELLTTDHTAAWLGMLNGWYAPGSREAQRDRYRLTRYAGHPGMPEPDLLNVSLRAGDLLLLCTDGVSDQIDDRTLAQVLDGSVDPAVLVERLLMRTLDNGGDDNATAVIIAVR
ncbi:PP2C family protein-serine/threonine phosphatase [Actinoplanes derwentensis]|uniref:Serine/threonine protein phosphatase PrpC n=1 Tax=Actinoplanes derwentensis TaxID=113562 RepID=A0A1H1SJR5_9ACTN|nr:SpoIIE family protein phosphatase [Actinoplanes derwentensis]GID83290.1 protein phosphatase [Actinoplanes derwentensis]SDS47966.1 Serine/threonine protein phosphatase PrpC [Actinoplanes derwentensis]